MHKVLLILLASIAIDAVAEFRGIHLSAEVKIHYYDSGKGRAVVFVPGWTMSHAVFERQRDEISRDHRFIAYDPRGQGNSSKTEGGHTYDQRGRDLEKFLHLLGLESVTLVGWSYGCFDVYSYIRQFGLNKVAGVVCIDQQPAPRRRNVEGEWAEAPMVVKRMFFEEILHRREALADEFAEWMLGHKPTFAQAKWLRDMHLKTPTPIALALARNALQEDFTPEVTRIAARGVPFLQIVRDDKQDEACNWLTRYAPQAKQRYFGPHMMFWEQADRFNKVLREFLTKNAL